MYIGCIFKSLGPQFGVSVSGAYEGFGIEGSERVTPVEKTR